MDEKALARLRCVECHGTLQEDVARLFCPACCREFQAEKGTYVFMPNVNDVPRQRWDQRLKLFARWRAERVPGVATAPPGTSLLEKFACFTGIHSGDVLDIGCASGEVRSYFQCDEYWGVDPLPLAGVTERLFKGMGEHLPFGDGSFDHVLLSQVLDHCADPVRVLHEALRVLVPGGKLHVLQYVVDRDYRWSGYLGVRFRRFLGFEPKVHSWETKARLLRGRDVKHLVEKSKGFSGMRCDERIHESQVFLTASKR